MPTPCWLKHLCSIRALVLVSFFLFLLSVCLSVSLSLYFWLIPWSAEARWAHFLAWASKTLSRRRTAPSPTREGARCLRAAAPALRTLLALHLNQGTSASFSYFLIVNSRPPGSGPLKDQHWTDLFIFLFNPTILCFYLVNGGQEERYLKKKKKTFSGTRGSYQVTQLAFFVLFHFPMFCVSLFIRCLLCSP